MLKEALQYIIGLNKPLTALGVKSDSVAVAEGFRLESLERFQQVPDRIRAQVSLTSSTSLCDYINRFKGEHSSIYLDPVAGRFQALLDHHGPGSPTWRQHTAKFQPKQSFEWKFWKEKHECWLGQTPFAELIERMLDTIEQPEPNVVLKAALDFQANENLTMKAAQNLDDGTVQFNFVKENVHKQVIFPHRIMLRLAIHDNELTALHEGRIRYRVSGEGVLMFKFSFVRDPSIIERDALLELARFITQHTEGLPHYEGVLDEGVKPV